MLQLKALAATKWRVRSFDVLSMLNILILFVLIILTLFSIRSFISKSNKTKYSSPLALFQPVSRESNKRGLMEYESILVNNPFGLKAGTLKQLGSSSSNPIQPSDMNMKLIGTISGGDLFSFAVFVGSDGKQEIFKVGETIPGNGSLKQVEMNTVFIENGNMVSQIPMVESATIDQNISPLSSGLSYSGVKKADKGEYVVDQKLIGKAMDNPGQFISNARLIPNMKDNRQEGFILKEVQKGGIHDSLGLRNDDVLMRINDYDITNPENALKAFTALRGMDKVRLDIIRSGKKTTMTYQIR